MSKPNPACLHCKKEMIRIKNGITVYDPYSGNTRAADMFECPICCSLIATDWAEEPMNGFKTNVDNHYDLIL